MTAIAMAKFDDGIVVANDGACYDPADGRLIGLRTKVSLMPEWSAVIAQRGAGGVLELVRSQIGMTPQGFDDLLDCLPDIARAVHADYFLDGHPRPRFSLFIGGWSEAREQFEVYSLRTDPFEFTTALTAEGLAVEPFILTPLDGYVAAPTWTEEAAARCGLLEGPDARPMDGYEWTARVVCAARLSDCERLHEGGSKIYGVGGFLQVTTLTRDSLTSDIVHRWPDPIGEPIDPERGELLPAFLTKRGDAGGN